MKKDYNANNGLKKDFKGGSPLALEDKTNTHYQKHGDMLKNISLGKKQLVFEEDKGENSLLDESNIKE